MNNLSKTELHLWFALLTNLRLVISKLNQDVYDGAGVGDDVGGADDDDDVVADLVELCC